MCAAIVLWSGRSFSCAVCVDADCASDALAPCPSRVAHVMRKHGVFMHCRSLALLQLRCVSCWCDGGAHRASQDGSLCPPFTELAARGSCDTPVQRVCCKVCAGRCWRPPAGSWTHLLRTRRVHGGGARLARRAGPPPRSVSALPPSVSSCLSVG